MTPVYCTLLLSLLVTVACAQTKASPAGPGDVKASARLLIDDARRLVARAKEGTSLLTLRKDVKALQEMASDLIQVLPGSISDCETKLVITMAAAGSGSHDVLHVLVARDHLAVLSGRLAMALSFLDHVAQQMEDELSLSGEIGGHLMAVVFGTNNTINIIESADKEVKGKRSKHNVKDLHLNRLRRQLRTNYNLGSGWSVGLGGVKWQNPSGSVTFGVKPTFSGFKPSGFSAGLTFRF